MTNADCLSTSDIISLLLGYTSITCWLFAQFPQLYANFKTKTAESVSLMFLAQWLTGDITNLIGCVLTNQMLFQTILASYFVFIDSSLLLQCLYYDVAENWGASIADAGVVESPVEEAAGGDESEPLLSTDPLEASIRTSIANINFTMLLLFTMVFVLLISVVGFITIYHPMDSYTIGRIMAWICTALYLSSRWPQIYWNFRRKSCAGLSISMFAFAVLGNLTYSLSIAVKIAASEGAGDKMDEFMHSLPYLLGSAGTVFFDMVIFTQFIVYR